MISEYSELQTAIQNWTNYNDSTYSDRIKEFIALAESKIKDRVRFISMERRAEATLSTSSKYLATPTGFLEGISFQLETSPLTILEFVSPNQINRLHVEAGKPTFYSVVGDEFVFNKVADSAYTAELAYYIFSPLSDSNTTNDVIDHYPSLYFNLSLAEAFKYLRDEQRASYFENLGEVEINRINQSDKRKKSITPVNVRGQRKIV